MQVLVWRSLWLACRCLGCAFVALGLCVISAGPAAPGEKPSLPVLPDVDVSVLPLRLDWTEVSFDLRTGLFYQLARCSLWQGEGRAELSSVQIRRTLPDPDGPKAEIPKSPLDEIQQPKDWCDASWWAAVEEDLVSVPPEYHKFDGGRHSHFWPSGDGGDARGYEGLRRATPAPSSYSPAPLEFTHDYVPDAPFGRMIREWGREVLFRAEDRTLVMCRHPTSVTGFFVLSISGPEPARLGEWFQVASVPPAKLATLRTASGLDALRQWPETRLWTRVLEWLPPREGQLDCPRCVMTRLAVGTSQVMVHRWVTGFQPAAESPQGDVLPSALKGRRVRVRDMVTQVVTEIDPDGASRILRRDGPPPPTAGQASPRPSGWRPPARRAASALATAFPWALVGLGVALILVARRHSRRGDDATASPGS